MGNTLTYATWHDEKIEGIQDRFEDSNDVLRWAYGEYGDDLVYACSFGAEGIVLIDLISQMKEDATVVFLDTDLHFRETYDVINQIKARYPRLNLTMLKPKITIEEQAELFGDKLWERNPNQCCHIRKVDPLTEALTGAPAWLSGLRREQSETRKLTNYINKDETFQSIKVCPLIHWTWDDVWAYLSRYDLPYNELHDQGYPSIGCEKCTFPTNDLHDLRSGRWAESSKTECGLH